MKKLSSNLLVIVALLLLAAPGEALTLYVAPEGSDSWSGESPRVGRGSDHAFYLDDLKVINHP